MSKSDRGSDSDYHYVVKIYIIRSNIESDEDFVIIIIFGGGGGVYQNAGWRWFK